MSLRKNLKKFVPIWTGMACCAMGCFYSCNDGYELIDEDPSWLGSSIYDYLKSNGNYTNVVRMIDDLGYTEVLARTGSKTLFVADDDAYARFYNNRTWGVGSYEELSQAQKKMLLYGAMINNSSQVAYLSSSAGPTEGDCMRRLTSSSAYDTVPILTPADMPDTKYWAYYKKAGKTIPCLEDATTAPMIHFIEAYLQNRRITNDDCNFLFNYSTERQAGDANVNGVNIAEQNIRCSNGFVHKMAEVMPPLPNLANRIAQLPRAKTFSKLLDRYSAPFYSETLTREYNRLYGTSYDSVFQKRFFSERSQPDAEGSEILNLTQDNRPVEALLKFDPGWNEFYSQLNASTATNVRLQQDMAVMLVPTDEAMNEYWNNGAGAVLKDRYGTWDNVPDDVLAELINVNMLNSFSNSVPSKFSTVLNDANDELGLSKENVDSVFFACNGAIYLTNKVFSPTAYISVSFPALVNENMSIINWAIKQLDYDVYLNSQNSTYSFFIPTDGALEYVDPVSFRVRQNPENPDDGFQPESGLQVYRFHYDPNALTEDERVYASIHSYDAATGVVGDSIARASTAQTQNRLKDILETHIVIGSLNNSNTYYKTKDGGVIKVENPDVVNSMKVYGGWQVENDASTMNGGASVVRDGGIYNQNNGKAYILEDAPIQTARNSVADILATHSEFAEFKKLLDASGLLTQVVNLNPSDEQSNYRYACPSDNINLFNTFNYTVYVPCNDSIVKMQENGELPTVEDLESPTLTEDARAQLLDKVTQFIKYHIQDNSFYIGEGDLNLAGNEYSTSAYTIDGNGVLSYLKVTPVGDNTHLSVTDAMGNTRKVITSGGLYNLMAREYQFDVPSIESATTIRTSSYAVVHLIDGPLRYE